MSLISPVFLFAAIGLWLTLAGPAQALQLSLVNSHPEGCNARASGPVAPGDSARIARLLPGGAAEAQYVVAAPRLCFDSEGGDYVEAIAIAEYLRLKGISSHVAEGARCIGPCALAFLGGTRATLDDSGVLRSLDRSIHAAAELGFDAPGLELAEDELTTEAVQAAFRDAQRATAAIFGSLAILSISRDFALEIFAMPQGQHLPVDTVARTIDAGIRVEGVRPLPDEMSQDQLREICERIDPELRPDHFDRPESTRTFQATAGLMLSPAATGARRGAWLTGYRAEGELYWAVCEVRWFQPRSGTGGVSARVLRQAAWNGQSGAPSDAPPTAAEIERLIEQATGPFTFFEPIVIFPAASKLADLAGDGEELPPAAANALCAPGADRYQVVNVSEFATLRDEPNFSANIIAEAPKDSFVSPVTQDETSALITSESCRAACDHATRDGLSAADFQAAADCRNSNDVWWRMAMPEGAAGWMSARFLSVR
ncbi:hypothetical protein [Marinovum sp.]|uniref:hypothetical protein n=1 Tax=Marinovum sp. TaxID=2024839 RepID=UPI002B269541|nr:hypothetical protein [Marinovum sp.]